MKRKKNRFGHLLLSVLIMFSMFAAMITYSTSHIAHADTANLVNTFDPDLFADNWGLWAGDGSTVTKEYVTGYKGNGVQINYNRSAAGWGLVAHAGLPATWELTGTHYLTFWYKGDGTDKTLSVGVEEKDGGDKFRKIVSLSGNAWHLVVIPVTDLERQGGGGNGTLDWDLVNSINISPEQNGAGSFVLDDFTFNKDGVLPSVEPDYSLPMILQDFNTDDRSHWEMIGDGGSGASIQAATVEQGVVGKAIQFNYKLMGWGAFTSRTTDANSSDWSHFTGISFWAKGQTGQQFRFRFEEGPAPNDIWRKTITLNSSEWQHITINFNDTFEDENSNGNNSLDLGNIYKYGFAPIGDSGAEGSLQIDEIVLTSPKGGLVVSNVRTETPASVFSSNSITLKVDLTNFGAEFQQKTLGYTVKNIAGETVKEGQMQTHTVLGNQSATETIQFVVDKFGYYKVDVYLVDGDNKLSLKSKTLAYIVPEVSDQGIPKKSSKSLLGFSTHYDFFSSDEMRNNEAGLIRLSGSNLSRNDFLWNQIEPSKGTFDWTLHDKIVDANYSRNIEMIGILDYSSTWGSSGSAGVEQREHYPPQQISDYANYVYQTVSRYKDKVHRWEIWNEPNLDGFFRPTQSAKAYVQLLKAGYLAAKRADPKATVVMAGLSGTGLAYLTEMLDLGAADYTDALVVHPYQGGDPEAGNAFISDLRSVREKAPNKALWITEWGWRSDEQGIVNQADYITKGYILARAMGVRNIALYSFNIASDTEFGIADSSISGEVKPAYAAVTAMNRILKNKEYVGDLSLGNNVNAFAFKEDGKEDALSNVIALWSPEVKTIQISSSTITALYDMYGNQTKLTPTNGKITVQLNNEPQYLSGCFCKIIKEAVPKFEKDKVIKTKPAKSWQVQSPYYQLDSASITRGFAGQLNIEIYNYQDDILEGSLQIAGLPATWFHNAQESKKSYSVPAYGSQVIHFDLIPPSSTLIGTYTANVTSTSHRLADEQYTIRITPTMEISLNKKAITLTNQITEAVTGHVEFDALPGWTIMAADNQFSLAAGASTSKAYSLTPGAQAATASGGGVVISGKVITAAEEIPFSQKLFAALAPQASTPITIDGVKDSEWDGVTPAIINNISQVSKDFQPTWTPDDDSASVYTKWDSANMYVLAQVKDNVQSQPQSGGSMWQGDSLQLGIDTGNIGGPGYGTNVFELQIGKPDGAQAQIFKGMGFPASGLMQTAQIVVNRDEVNKITTYEMKIPFSEFGGMSDQTKGKAIGYSILINDNDGVSRKGYIEWSSGIGASKNASQFGTLWLN